MSFHFFSKCSACRKKRFFISHRSYIAPIISQQPVTSNNELCGQCFRAIKKLIK